MDALGLYSAYREDDGTFTFEPAYIETPPPVFLRLLVPWLSQLGQRASYAGGDCGPACLAMWLRYLGHDVTVDDVSPRCWAWPGFSYTMPAHIINGARHWGVDLYWGRYLYLRDVLAELDAGQPVIVLVNYPALPARYDANYARGHWLLITGYTDTEIFYHDPYWRDVSAQAGADIHISQADFMRAWGLNVLNGNSVFQALRMRR